MGTESCEIKSGNNATVVMDIWDLPMIFFASLWNICHAQYDPIKDILLEWMQSRKFYVAFLLYLLYNHPCVKRYRKEVDNSNDMRYN